MSLEAPGGQPYRNDAADTAEEAAERLKERHTDEDD